MTAMTEPKDHVELLNWRFEEEIGGFLEIIRYTCRYTADGETDESEESYILATPEEVGIKPGEMGHQWLAWWTVQWEADGTLRVHDWPSLPAVLDRVPPPFRDRMLDRVSDAIRQGAADREMQREYFRMFDQLRPPSGLPEYE